MLKLKSAVVVALLTAGLTACASDGSAEVEARHADIARISELREGFGPEYKVTDVPKTGIDPRMFESQPVPRG